LPAWPWSVSRFWLLRGAAAPDLPTFAATKVDGTDNVHIFRYLRHQSMFVATPKGLIAIA
jgi:hypothetical protein